MLVRLWSLFSCHGFCWEDAANNTTMEGAANNTTMEGRCAVVLVESNYVKNFHIRDKNKVWSLNIMDSIRMLMLGVFFCVLVEHFHTTVIPCFGRMNKMMTIRNAGFVHKHVVSRFVGVGMVVAWGSCGHLSRMLTHTDRAALWAVFVTQVIFNFLEISVGTCWIGFLFFVSLLLRQQTHQVLKEIEAMMKYTTISKENIMHIGSLVRIIQDQYIPNLQACRCFMILMMVIPMFEIFHWLSICNVLVELDPKDLENQGPGSSAQRHIALIRVGMSQAAAFSVFFFVMVFIPVYGTGLCDRLRNQINLLRIRKAVDNDKSSFLGDSATIHINNLLEYMDGMNNKQGMGIAIFGMRLSLNFYKVILASYASAVWVLVPEANMVVGNTILQTLQVFVTGDPDFMTWGQVVFFIIHQTPIFVLGVYFMVKISRLQEVKVSCTGPCEEVSI